MKKPDRCSRCKRLIVAREDKNMDGICGSVTCRIETYGKGALLKYVGGEK